MSAFAAASPRARRWYSVFQALGLACTVVLLAGLFVRPQLTLHLLWDRVIPLLPAVFLINPMLWRNVCPLAAANALTGKRFGRRRLMGRALRVAWGIGLLLLAVLVPARRFLFNTDGPALGGTIAIVAVLAAAGGLVWSRRAGFCNSFCPVLPVEKLYGQFPLVQVPSAHCDSCTSCTSGCIDVSAEKAALQTVGPSRRSSRWLTTPFGLFAIAFPGFVVGYFTCANGPLGDAPVVYLHVFEWAAASAVALGGLVLATRTGARTAVPLLGALAFGLYYWFVAPALAEAYGGGPAGAVGVRLAAGALLAVWFVKTPLLRELRAAF